MRNVLRQPFRWELSESRLLMERLSFVYDRLLSKKGYKRKIDNKYRFVCFGVHGSLGRIFDFKGCFLAWVFSDSSSSDTFFLGALTRPAVGFWLAKSNLPSSLNPPSFSPCFSTFLNWSYDGFSSNLSLATMSKNRPITAVKKVIIILKTNNF